MNNFLLGRPYRNMIHYQVTRDEGIVGPSFGLEEKTYDIAIPIPVLPTSYRIGLLVGPSGTGKSSLLRHFSTVLPAPEWSESSILSQVGNADFFMDVGLHSVPSWFLPYSALSGGERERADVARKIIDANEQTVSGIDEFTATLDRITAYGLCRCLQRALKRRNTAFIFASVHRDIISWLQPDWVWDTRYHRFLEVPPLPRITVDIAPPCAVKNEEISLQVREDGREYWNIFSPFHYLNADLAASARIWTIHAEEGPVALIATLPLPMATVGLGMRIHRLVVLPEYQGLGIGPRFCEWAGNYWDLQGVTLYIKTSHPRMGLYLEHSSFFEPTAHNGKNRNDTGLWTGNRRICFCYRYRRQHGNPLVNRMAVSTISEMPLTLRGTLIETSHYWTWKYRHHGTRFLFSDYGGRSEARRAAENYQLEESLKEKTNVYRILGETVVISIGDMAVHVDTEDLPKVAQRKWVLRKMRDGMHACCTINEKRVYMEEVIANLPWSCYHRDGDALNCRKNNLVAAES